jgi:hypothetical protein
LRIDAVRHFQLLVLGTLLAAAATGCARDQTLRQKLFQPGPTQYQRQRGEKFDPYSELPVGNHDDRGTGRPNNYQEPNPEAARGRWDEWGWPRFGHDPPPGAVYGPG